MKIVAIAAAALLLGQDGKEAGELVRKTRASSSYRVTFKAVIKTPGSDPFVMEGQTVWVNPGVLYIHSKASGGDEKRIVRAGKDVFLHVEVLGEHEWVTADEVGQSGAGRGIQNPDEVLAVLAGHLGDARWTADRKALRLSMAGEDIEKVMKEQAKSGTFDWKQSSCTIDLVPAPDGRIDRFSCNASLASLDPALKGKKVGYSAEVNVVAYDKDRELRFEIIDPKLKKPVPLEIPKTLRDLVDAQLKTK